jgi:hypothetical protein
MLNWFLKLLFQIFAVAAIHNIAADIDRTASALDATTTKDAAPTMLGFAATDALSNLENDRGLSNLVEHLFYLPVVSKKAKLS